MAGAETTWIARLTPTADGSVAALLDLPLGLDVWERPGGRQRQRAPGFPLTAIDGQRYWDGGLFSNLPLKRAIDALEAAASDDSRPSGN